MNVRRCAFSKLALRSPELGRERLRNALELSGGNAKGAGRILGLTKSSLWRWIGWLEMHEELQRIRKRTGWGPAGWQNPTQFISNRLRA